MVHRDERVIAFMDTSPVTPGHVLVAPREHANGLEDLNPHLGAHTWLVAHRVARGLRRSGLRCDGVNILLSDGSAAFQDVFHVHLHVIPRYHRDSFRIEAEWLERDSDMLESDAVAVRAGLRDLMSEGPVVST
ncbi:HIT family protein [Salinactinospora qingdaonensis]|uniref:HIT family protein n=1 Tax=Salinactinospora qingdaonensis TaxID=702744 RepID=A0ABP7FG48_9ACTN